MIEYNADTLRPIKNAPATLSPGKKYKIMEKVKRVEKDMNVIKPSFFHSSLLR